MSLTESIREAAAAGDLVLAARRYDEYVEQAAGLVRAGAGSPALIQEARALLDLARRQHLKLRETLTAELQESRNRAYVAERYE
jgi:hypothetical protein